ncbi:MAG: hypothetical protein ABIO44_04135 [Saprospiraceae bacterium]
MKIKFLFLGVCSLLFQCRNMYKEPFVNITHQVAEVHFERPMTQELLNEIKTKLEAEGIIINYTTINWDGKLLSKLGFEIIDNKGRRGAATTNFVNLRGKAFGFRVDLGSGNGGLIVGDL